MPTLSKIRENAFVIFCIYLAFSKYGSIRLGGKDAEPELNKVLDFMNTTPNVSVELRSHTDARGKAEYNMVLSEKRANKVQELLVASGIDASRLTARGAGEDASVDKDSPAARQLVRRVTLKLK